MNPTSTVKQPDNELLSDEGQTQPIEPSMFSKGTTSLISEINVGMSYMMTVVHIGMAMVNERKGEPLYGCSLRAEFSHKSGSIHVKVMGGHKGFWQWLRHHEDVLTTECKDGWKLKRRIVKAVSLKVQRAYVMWTMQGCPSSEGL